MSTSQQTVFFNNPATISNLQATTASLSTSLAQTQNGWGTPIVPPSGKIRSVNGLIIDNSERMICGSSLDNVINIIDKESGEHVGIFQQYPFGNCDDIAQNPVTNQYAWGAILPNTPYGSCFFTKATDTSTPIQITTNIPAANSCNFSPSGTSLFGSCYPANPQRGILADIFKLNQNATGPETPPLQYTFGLTGGLNGFSVWTDDSIYGPNVFPSQLIRLVPTTGCITSYTISTGGTGYTSATTSVVITPNVGGAGAAGVARVSSGRVTGITVHSVGTGYFDGATVSINSSIGGTGALAVANASTGFYKVVLAEAPTGASFISSNIDSNGFVWVVSSQGTLYKYDRTSGALLASILISTNAGLDNLCFDSAATGSIYISSYGENAIWEYNQTYNTFRNVKAKSLNIPCGLALSPDGRTLFISDCYSISALDTTSSTAVPIPFYRKLYALPAELPYFVSSSINSPVNWPFTIRSSPFNPNTLFSTSSFSGRTLQFLFTGPSSLYSGYTYQAYTGSYPNGSYQFIPFGIDRAEQSPFNLAGFGTDSSASPATDIGIVSTGSFAGNAFYIAGGKNLLSCTGTTLFPAVVKINNLTGAYQMAPGNDGYYYATETNAGTLVRIDTLGGTYAKTVVATGLRMPLGIARAPNGQFVVEEVGAKCFTLVNPANGKRTTFATNLPIGLPGYAASVFNTYQSPPFCTPIAIKADGTIYYGSTINCGIYTIPYSAYSSITNA